MTQKQGGAYAGLVKKLGIGPRSVVFVSGAPAGFMDMPVPEGARLALRVASPDMAVVFARDLDELEARFGGAAERIPNTGSVWVAWPKKSSGVVTDLSFDAVQRHGLDAGWVDTKICAIDDTWSGLRFMVPLRSR